MTTPRIIINNLCFHREQTSVQFEKFNLSFARKKYGLVGANGIGKTTLLKLLLGELQPESGTIQTVGNIIEVPQSHAVFAHDQTISDVLGVSKILNALKRINNGSVLEDDFAEVDGWWDIEARIEEALRSFNLWPIALNSLFHTLSGGQKTKVLLAKTRIYITDFVILDEPTNNLDKKARNILYNYIQAASVGMIIVSHDRNLLNQLDCIVELNTNGLDVYGGNYDFYKAVKAIKREAVEREVDARSKSLQQSQKIIQSRMERHQKNESKGNREKNRQINSKGRYDKIEMKAKKGCSESTNRTIRLQADRKMEAETERLEKARLSQEITSNIDVSFPKTKVPNNKVVLKLENICFKYPNNDRYLIEDLDFQITGPERVAFTGPNGCGKSTILKIGRASCRERV